MVPLPAQRSQAKPRKAGLTMLVDWGLPLGRTRDLLDLAGPYIDLAKIATGTARLYGEDQLAAKLALYEQHNVTSFLGGQFQEYVYATQGGEALPAFLDEACRVGFTAVEISDNYVPLSRSQRREQTTMALERGLSVLSEVGGKEDSHDPETLVADARAALEAGASLLLVEGAELVEAGQSKRDLIVALRDGIGLEKLIFELPGPWVSGVNPSEIHDLKKLLVAQFGPDVNIGNVMPDDVIETEALRVGLGVVGPKASVAADNDGA
ncbi:MAG: phosphosulfolactate synthase [Dichotomicrobium sp.]